MHAEQDDGEEARREGGEADHDDSLDCSSLSNVTRDSRRVWSKSTRVSSPAACVPPKDNKGHTSIAGVMKERISYIRRGATVAWGPTHGTASYIAAGTVAGAISDSFDASTPRSY